MRIKAVQCKTLLARQVRPVPRHEETPASGRERGDRAVAPEGRAIDGLGQVEDGSVVEHVPRAGEDVEHAPLAWAGDRDLELASGRQQKYDGDALSLASLRMVRHCRSNCARLFFSIAFAMKFWTLSRHLQRLAEAPNFLHSRHWQMCLLHALRGPQFSHTMDSGDSRDIRDWMGSCIVANQFQT